MSSIAKEFEPNVSRIRHWLAFDHLRPEQGIALLVGLDADEVAVNALANWGENKRKDDAILGSGVSFLNGDTIKISHQKESVDEEGSYRERIHLYERDHFIDAEGESDYAMTKAELDLNFASVEAEAAALAAATDEAEYEMYENFLTDLEDARTRFSICVQKYRLWLQYWHSGEHLKPTPLLDFVEWALSKNLRPEWLSLEMESYLYTVRQGKGAENSAPPEKATLTFFDKTSTTYPPELDIALRAWREISTTVGKGKPKLRIMKWLDDNAKELSNEAKNRIATVVNWDKSGGATRTD